MTDDNFITFQRFNDMALLEDFVELLKANQIEYAIEDFGPAISPALVNLATRQESEVKIRQQDFKKVNQLLRDAQQMAVEQVSGDHYLFTFTDYELLEVLSKADEWSAFDYALAKKILKKRGVQIDENKEEELRLDRIKELSVKAKSQDTLVVIGYIFALAGGLFGILIGWSLANSKKTLPDGTQIFTYQNNDRWHGRNIMFLGILCLISAIIYKFEYMTS